MSADEFHYDPDMVLQTPPDPTSVMMVILQEQGFATPHAQRLVGVARSVCKQAAESQGPVAQTDRLLAKWDGVKQMLYALGIPRSATVALYRQFESTARARLSEVTEVRGGRTVR